MEELIKLVNVDLGYGKHVVLRQLSVGFRRETITAILGDNGSGKTTLVDALAGFAKPLSGTIETEVDMRIGFVPQEESLNPEYLLSGFDVVAMGTYGRVTPGMPFPGVEADCVRECLQAADALEFAQQSFGQLSGGQKQRILIARALAARPQLLLLDEPTSGVDTKATQEIMASLRKIQLERKLTVILVTHDFGLVRRFADEVVWLRDGEAEQGATESLLSREHVAERLGLV